MLKKKYSNFPDEKLLEFIQQGDSAGRAAFDELYERYSQRLLFYFYRMLGGQPEKAQDFLQDLFLKVVERPESFNPTQRFRTWIYTVAHNMCKNEYRRLKVSKIVESTDHIETFASGTGDADIIFAQEIDQQRFQQALGQELAKFDANQRTTFLLRYQNDFAIKEISEILGCSEGTTKSRLFYTTKKLALKLSAFHPKVSEV